MQDQTFVPPPVALVTGAGRRIGQAIALELAATGFDLALHYRSSREEADAVLREVEGLGRRAVLLQADLASEAAVEGLLPRAAEALGPVGVLVNNAAAFERDEWDSVDRAGWDLHMEVNLRAPFVLSQAFARRLPTDAGGLILNLLDQRVWNLTPHFVSYTLSKTGLWTLTQTLALALAPRIRVNGLGPGPTLIAPKQTEAQFRRQVEALPLRRRAALSEFRAAVRFLLDAPSVTGQMIALDGGQHLAWSHSAPASSDEGGGRH